MDSSFEALQRFISNHHLKLQDGTTAFSAVVHIRLNGQLQVIQSDIQIITSNNLGTIYILGLDKNEGYVPDMLEAKKNSFTYNEGKGLNITGVSAAGNFIILILPKEK